MLPLPQGHLILNPALLGECAMNCRAYAKALHYKELEFHKGPNTTRQVRGGGCCVCVRGRSVFGNTYVRTSRLAHCGIGHATHATVQVVVVAPVATRRRPGVE